MAGLSVYGPASLAATLRLLLSVAAFADRIVKALSTRMIALSSQRCIRPSGGGSSRARLTCIGVALDLDVAYRRGVENVQWQGLT